VGHRRADVLGHVHRHEQRPLLVAARAQAPLATREGHEHLVLAVGAADAGEAVVQVTALEKPRHGRPDGGAKDAVARLVALGVNALEGVEVVVEELVKGRGTRAARAVDALGGVGAGHATDSPGLDFDPYENQTQLWPSGASAVKDPPAVVEQPVPQFDGGGVGEVVGGGEIVRAVDDLHHECPRQLPQRVFLLVGIDAAREPAGGMGDEGRAAALLDAGEVGDKVPGGHESVIEAEDAEVVVLGRRLLSEPEAVLAAFRCLRDAPVVGDILEIEPGGLDHPGGLGDRADAVTVLGVGYGHTNV